MTAAARKKPLDQEGSDQLRAMGAAIRDTRRGRLSLEELAARAGVSAGQLSHIENGTGNPSVEMLIRIMSVLNLSVNDLFEPSPATSTYVIRAGQRRRYRPLDSTHDVELLTPGIRFQMSGSAVVLPPGQTQVSGVFNGASLFFVLSGCLEIRRGDETFRLGPRDSIIVSFAHSMAAVGDIPAEYIAVFAPSEG
jgi:transcriptional regulator with XRE-family HTH domain